MSLATYSVLVDWTGSGLFDGEYDNITSLVKEAVWSYGRDYASQLTGRSMAGSASLTVKNYDGRFSSFKSTGVLYGNLLPARKLKITMTVGETTTVEWQGFLDTIEPQPRIGGKNLAVIRAIGPLGLVQRADVSVAAKTNILTGAAITEILDEADWPAADRAIDVGQTTMSRWWTSGKVSALNAMRDIEATEVGFVRETKAGAIAWEDRHHRLVAPHTSSVATYTDATDGALRYRNIQQLDPLKEIFNIVKAQVQTYAVGDLAVLWTLAETPSIGAGETLTLWANFPNPSSAVDAHAVNAWTTPVANTDYTANAAADGSSTDLTGSISIVATKFANSMKLEITNNHATTAAYLTLLQARGTPITANDPMPVSADDSTSQTRYGTRNYPSPGVFIPTIAEADDHVKYLLAIYKDPIPVLTLSFRANSSAAQLADCQARDVSERVTVVATGQSDLGINGDFFIEAIRHRVSNYGTNHLYEMDLSPSEGYSGFWVLGTSLLGTETKLGY